MKKITLFTICMLFFSSMMYSQASTDWNPENGQKYKHSFGLGGGGTSGFGFSYRYLPKDYGFMLTAAPIYDKSEDFAVLSGGLTLEKVLSRFSSSMLYTYLSNGIYYSKYREDNTDSGYNLFNNDYYNSVYNSYTIHENMSWNSGFGFGIEFHSAKRVVVNFMVGFGQYDSFNKILPTGEFYLFYRYN